MVQSNLKYIKSELFMEEFLPAYYRTLDELSSDAPRKP